MRLRSRLVLSYGLIVLLGSGLLVGITTAKVVSRNPVEGFRQPVSSLTLDDGEEV